MLDCPCCERPMEDAGGLRLHLLTNHRKSELTDALMAEVEDGPESRLDEREPLAIPS